jgi:hypothetical protein
MKIQLSPNQLIILGQIALYGKYDPRSVDLDTLDKDLVHLRAQGFLYKSEAFAAISQKQPQSDVADKVWSLTPLGEQWLVELGRE